MTEPTRESMEKALDILDRMGNYDPKTELSTDTVKKDAEMIALALDTAIREAREEDAKIAVNAVSRAVKNLVVNAIRSKIIKRE